MSLFGDIMGGGTQKVTNEPWNATDMTRGYKGAWDLYNAQKNEPYFSRSLYAGLNPTQLNAINMMTKYSGGMGQNLVNAMSGAAQGALVSGMPYGTQAQSIYNKAMEDPTAGILASAGQYANNPYMDQMVDAASRDITRNLNENLLPGAAMNTAATGNLGSSRSAIERGILERGTAEAIGDIGATLRGNAYNTGLGTAAGLYGTGLTGALGANAQTGNLYGMGLNAVNPALNAAAVNAGAMSGAGGQMQADQQAKLNEAYQQWAGQMQWPWTTLNNYWNITGNPVGGITSSPGQPLLQTAAGLGLTGAGTYGILNNAGAFGGTTSTQPQVMSQSSSPMSGSAAQTAMMMAMMGY